MHRQTGIFSLGLLSRLDFFCNHMYPNQCNKSTKAQGVTKCERIYENKNIIKNREQ